MNKFFSGDTWSRLQAAVRKSKRPADVAVAYLGRGAAKLLPLTKGSRLVVDASEPAVMNGQTCPDELKLLVTKRGAIVYSVGNLHAKVFVVGSTAFVGSGNASNHSANTLIEALVATTDPEVVSSARAFVRDLCLQELGPEELDRLQKIYRPPRVPRSLERPDGRNKRTPALSRIRIVQLERAVLPDGAVDAEEAGSRAAQKQMADPGRHLLDNFFWTGRCPFKVGDNLVQVVRESSGKRLADPPARVVHKEEWLKGRTKYTFVYTERTRKRRVEVGRLARKIGSGARKQLLSDGVVNKHFARRLLAAWSIG